MTYHVPPDTPETARPTTDFWVTRLGILLVMEIGILLIIHPVSENLPGAIGHHLSEALLLSSIVAAWLFTPIFVYKDIQAVEHTHWPHRGRAYLIGTLLCPLPVGVYYAYRRYRVFGTPSIPFGAVLRPEAVTEDTIEPVYPPSNWWVVVVLALVSEGVFFVYVGLTASNAPLILIHPSLAVLMALAPFRFIILPIAIYKDATAVRQSAIAWNPNRVLLALGGWFLCLFVCPYYLSRRLAYLPSIDVTDRFARTS